MLSRQIVFCRNIKIQFESLKTFRRSYKFSRQFPSKSSLHPIFYQNFRHATGGSAIKNYVPLVLGLSLAGGGVLAYYVKNKKEPSLAVEEIEEPDYPPFIPEHLEEDLALLKEFGPVPYLLIGAGPASFAAYRAIRTRDPVAKVLMIGEEPVYPYMRPPLSKEMFFDKQLDNAETLSFTQWDGKTRSLFYESAEYYFSVKDLLENKNGGVSVIRGKRVVRVDPVSQTVFLDGGEQITYNKCLIATGSHPKNLPVFENADDSVKKNVSVFRTVRDYQKLDKICKKSKSIAIVGGGFLGSELACGLVKRFDLNVIQLFPESGNIGKVLPDYLSKWTSGKLAGQGVKVIPDVTVKSVSAAGKRVKMVLSDDQVVEADHVIVAVGAEANTQFAKASGLEVDDKYGGFLVNTEMEARKNLWVAGDASCFYDTNLGRRRVEHHDHAIVSGKLAGENMSGNAKPYWHQSMFWSDLGPDIGLEAIGLVDSTLPTMGVFPKNTAVEVKSDQDIQPGQSESGQTTTENSSKAPNSEDVYNKGVIFYLRDDVIVGILMWNVFSKMQLARQIINEAKTQEDIAEIAKLFELNAVAE